MATAYFVVDHVTDENKKEGLVESYQMVPVQYQQEDGTIASGFRRINFVHWPELPNPFVHEEWSEDLVFTNIYTPEDDTELDYGLAGEDEGDEDEDEDEESDDYSGIEAQE